MLCSEAGDCCGGGDVRVKKPLGLLVLISCMVLDPCKSLYPFKVGFGGHPKILNRRNVEICHHGCTHIICPIPSSIETVLGSSGIAEVLALARRPSKIIASL